MAADSKGTPEAQAILAGLKPLFERARKEGLWFWCSYQGLWFTPDELEAEHRRGSFIWGAVNWSLRDPKELVAEAEVEAANAARRLAEVRRRVG